MAVASILFGLAHVTNIFAGVSVKAALIQAAGAAVMGALLCAIYLRTRNIWAVVFLHAFMDFSSLIPSGMFGVSSAIGEINNYSYLKLLVCIVYLIPALVVLRKKKLQEIIERERLIKHYN
ncbi:MAG: CPBP family intramembrane metalloprotease [Bacillota bacterium]|nr:CPBP family intramembrane metalloprotease [Bacillota bacterium]